MANVPLFVCFYLRVIRIRGVFKSLLYVLKHWSENIVMSEVLIIIKQSMKRVKIIYFLIAYTKHGK